MLIERCYLSDRTRHRYWAERIAFQCREGNRLNGLGNCIGVIGIAENESSAEALSCAISNDDQPMIQLRVDKERPVAQFTSV